MRKKGSKKGPRRYQRLRVVLISGLLFTMALIILVATIGNQKFGPLHEIALETVGPLQKMFSGVTSSIVRFKDNYLALVHVRAENKRLWRELRESRQEAHENREAMATNVRLRRLLELKESMNLPSVTASIVGKDPSLWFRTVIIDRGARDRIKKGMPVVAPEGVVGQVVATSPNYSKVLLAIAPSSAIDVLLQKSRVRGILKGNGTLTYHLDYILKNVEVKEGDQVVTAGYGGHFSTGLLVGTVSGVTKRKRGMFQEIEVTPAVDFLTLEQVIVFLQAEPFADTP